MRPLFIIIIVTAVSWSVWQRFTLAELRATETDLRGQAAEFTARAHSPDPETTTEREAQLGLSDKELAAFTAGALNFRDLRKSRKDALAMQQMWLLYEPLRRLTSEQLAAVFDTLTEGLPITDALLKDTPVLNLFACQAAGMNPLATLEFLHGNSYGSEDVGGVVNTALASLFRKDPAALLAWSQSQNFPAGTKALCAMWTDAARSALEPTVENIRRFLSHRSGKAQTKPELNLNLPSQMPRLEVAGKTEADSEAIDLEYYKFRMRTEIALKLSSQESRLEFFRVLKDADGDGGKETQAFIDQFTKRISFAQLAQIADSISDPPKALMPDESTRERPKNVRFRVALKSRDATPIDRWNWLTQRAADRPSGNALHDLIHGWCEDNYPATADFVRSLPAGRERQAMTDTVAQFLSENGAEKLAKEWTGR
jgi:hypothetical protein